MRVLVLGCGPAGLTAAHAAAMERHDIIILSKPRKSRMNGAQYLHAPIPVVSQPGDDFIIDYQLQGDSSAYKHKVYGTAQIPGGVSPDTLAGRAPAWDIRAAYDRLWAAYGPYVRGWEAGSDALDEAMAALKPDLVISSIPAPLLCHEGHAFTKATIWATDKALHPVKDDTVLCNGLQYPSWYRTSRIQGYENTEWGAMSKPPITPLWKVEKPLKTNCNCYSSILKVGRYGKWRKGALVHEVYGEVANACRAVA